MGFVGFWWAWWVSGRLGLSFRGLVTFLVGFWFWSAFGFGELGFPFWDLQWAFRGLGGPCGLAVDLVGFCQLFVG